MKALKNLPGEREVQTHSPAPMAHAFEDEHEHQHAKKSVLAKVKEKALKWRHAIARKKHGHDKGNDTPAWGVCLDEDDDAGQDPEYHGAPMYESETAPDVYEQTAPQQQQRTTRTGRKEPKMHHQPSIQRVTKHVDELALQNLDEFSETATPSGKKALVAGTLPFRKVMRDDLDDEEASCMTPPPSPVRVLKPIMETKAIESKHVTDMKKSASNNTLTKTVSQIIAPAYNMVSDATQSIISKIQRPTADEELGAKMKHDNKMKYDKGVSLKEYVLQKLEPGEDDRALSEVITESMSPRKTKKTGEKSVVEKVRDAVYALVVRESSTETPIPVSTNPHAVDLEEAGGRKLPGRAN